MQIRCSTCTKTIAIAPTGALPPECPHCRKAPVPERVGPYALDRLVATGGMGEVYLAHHGELGTEVAIKLLPAMPLDAVEGVRERFAREARLTAKVEHRGVVRVVQSDLAGDRPFLVLEYVRGRTLRALLDDGALAPTDVVRIVADTADVIAAAHEQGVLHRDIKPDNVMLQDDGAVRVLDFGIARAVADDAPLTRTGEIVGTPEYMAPEQLLDGPEATDERTDVHALGVLAYELLTGRSPYRGANVFQSLKLVESLVVPPPSQAIADLPTDRAAALDRAVGTAMAKLPGERFGSPRAFAAALRAAIPPAIPDPDRRVGVGATRRPLHDLALIGLGSFVSALCLWGVFALWYDAKTPTTVDPAGSEEGVVAASTAGELAREVRTLLDDGQWCQALTAIERSEFDDVSKLRPAARAAFVLGHAVWPHVAEAPPWLAACDLGQRRRVLGDRLEPTQDTPDVGAMVRWLDGDTAAWTELTGAPQVVGPAAIELLGMRSLAPAERAHALASYAQRLPIDAPEHWLARTIARHLLGDRQGAAQAAEMAWLSGAGELAVLLDAALALPRADAVERQRLWQRVAKGDRDDCAASTLLLLWIESCGVAGVRFDPSVARTFPQAQRSAAARWFVDSAEDAQPSGAGLCMLRTAVSLGAEPDFAASPWQGLTASARTLIEKEAQR